MGWYTYSNLWEILFLRLHAWKQLSSLFIKTACTLKHLPSGKLSSWLTLTWELIQAAEVCEQGSTEQCVGIRLFHNTNWQQLLFWESGSAGIQALCLTTDFQGACPFPLNKQKMLESQGTTVHTCMHALFNEKKEQFARNHLAQFTNYLYRLMPKHLNWKRRKMFCLLHFTTKNDHKSH